MGLGGGVKVCVCVCVCVREREIERENVGNCIGEEGVLMRKRDRD